MYEYKQLLFDVTKDFYNREIRLDMEYDHKQLMYICDYNFNRLKSLTPDWEDNEELNRLADEVGSLFSRVNEVELFMVRMESVNTKVASLYDWKMIEELEQDLCDSVLAAIKRNWIVNFDYSNNKKVRNSYTRLQSGLPKLFLLYPCLWMVPYLNQIHTARLSQRRLVR